MLQFFEKAAENVKENVGDDVQTDQLIKEACRNVLEHVRRREGHVTSCTHMSAVLPPSCVEFKARVLFVTVAFFLPAKSPW